MPGKSRRGRWRQPPQRKKGKGRRSPLAIVAHRKAVAQSYESVSHPEVSTPSVSVPTSMVTLSTARYPYIVTELRRIGILAGIILAILVVLALVLA